MRGAVLAGMATLADLNAVGSTMLSSRASRVRWSVAAKWAEGASAGVLVVSALLEPSDSSEIAVGFRCLG